MDRHRFRSPWVKRWGPVAAGALATLALQAVPAAAAAGGLAVWGDSVSHDLGCLETNQYARGDTVVFRADATLNGAQDRAAKVAVHIVGGPVLPMVFGQHGKGKSAPYFWSAGWALPWTAPAGPVNFYITALDPRTHASATFRPFPVPPSLLTVMPGSYTVAVTVLAAERPVQSVSPGTPLAIQVKVTRPGTPPAPLAAGKVTAAIGLQGNVEATGRLIAARRVGLSPSKTAGLWSGTLATNGLAAGLYVVEVQAQDGATPPNTGTGDSLVFRLS